MTKEYIEKLLEKVTEDLNITETQFDAAEAEYKNIGNWIDKNTPQYKIDIYPQGSFALGTVVKPIDREDEYDIDLVCEYQEEYGFEAEELKAEVHSILSRYKKCEKIEEKSRCWQVIYEHCRKFHLDVIPAINCQKYISITDKQNGKYNYLGSNPKGYIEWFQNKQKATYQQIRECMRFQAEIEEVKEYHIKTPLQKVIQILKRHRDVMFVEDKNNCKPVSIIITTMAAQLYNHEDKLIDTLSNILNGAEEYIRTAKKDEEYYIENPTYTGEEKENFADKWNKHPERATAFLRWVKQAKADLDIEKMQQMTLPELGRHIKKILGDKTGDRVFNALADETRKGIQDKNLKLDSKTGKISALGAIAIPLAHHHGKTS